MSATTNICAFDVPHSGLMSGAHCVSTTIFLYVSDVCAMVELIYHEGESEGRVVISHSNAFYHGAGQRIEMKGKLVNRCVFCFGWKRFPILCLLQVDNVWRN